MGQEYSTLCFCKRKNNPANEPEVSVYVIPDPASGTDDVRFETEENPYYCIRDIDIYQDLSNFSYRRGVHSVGYESQDSAYSDTLQAGYFTPISDSVYDIFPDLDAKRVRQISQRLRQQSTSSNVEFMIEAFRPQIEGSVRALEIVPHVTFIDDIEPYRLIARRSPREAMGRLIDEIRTSDEPGKWQTFLMALETAGYKYIVNLLKGETEADHTLQRKLLRLFTPAIMKDMNPKEFVDLLLEKDVITDADKEEIRCEGRNYGDIAASLMLLEWVPKRVENWYEIFLEVLETCGLGHLVEYLKPDDTELYTMYPLTYPGPNVKPRSHPSSGSSLTLLTAERDRLEQQIQYWNQKRLLQIEVSSLQKDLQSLIEDQPSDTVPTKCAGNDLYLPKTDDKKADNDVCEIRTEPVAVAKTTQETELFQILNDLKNEIKQDFRVDIEDLKRYIATELVKNTSKYQKSDQTDVQMDHTADALGYIPAPTTHKMVRSASDSGLGSLPSSQFSWGVYNV